MNSHTQRTKEYYNQISHESLCNCAFCRLYYARSAEMFPQLKTWLEKQEIAINKPFEVMYQIPDKDNNVVYHGVQYIAFGNCEEDLSVSLGDIQIRKAPSHSDTGIQEEHFLLEAYPMQIPYDPAFQ